MAKKDQCEKCIKYKQSAYGLKCSEYGRTPVFDENECQFFSDKNVSKLIDDSKVDKQEHCPIKEEKLSSKTEIHNENSLVETDTIPKDSLVWSIVSMMCFFPTGLAAIIYSVKVDQFWYKGEKQYSAELSKRARKMRVLSWQFFVGLLLLYIIIFLVLE